MTTKEVQKALGGLSQPRISQLVRAGILVAEDDGAGRLWYDRDSVERLARKRAADAARSEEDAESRVALLAERQDKIRRERARAAAAQAERQKRDDDWKQRAVVALEVIAQSLKAGVR